MFGGPLCFYSPYCSLRKNNPKVVVWRFLSKIFFVPKTANFWRFLEAQFWRHATTSDDMVTIAPSVLRALRVNSGTMVDMFGLISSSDTNLNGKITFDTKASTVFIFICIACNFQSARSRKRCKFSPVVCYSGRR